MLLSVFQLFLRWLVFIAVIWPVRAGAVALPSSSSVKPVYWQSFSFSVSLPKNINPQVCNSSFVTKYFKAEKDLMTASIAYVKQHTNNLKQFYAQIDLDLKKKQIEKDKWTEKKVGLNHLNQYAESLYIVSDNLIVFFNQLKICWKERSSSFISLQKVIKNYRLQDALLAEVMFYFSDQLQQVFSLLNKNSLSVQDKKQILDKGKAIMQVSEEMQAMLLANYAILSKDLRYSVKVY